MKSYNNFIGIDIGKSNFDVALFASKQTQTYENNVSGIKRFLKEFKPALMQSLCIIEPTGGYERALLLSLCNQGFAVHRANTRQVKDFIRSYGNGAKTDKLDALNLSRYGYERGSSLALFIPPSQPAQLLYELVQRRTDLKHMLIAEKNRFQSSVSLHIQQNIQLTVDFLSAEIKKITDEITRLIAQDAVLNEKKKILKTIPGIGEIVANELLILLPELGKLSRRKIASLVGLAPIAKDSGKYKGYRRTGHGRAGIKPLLFLSAMAARNSKSSLKIFYESLITRGKSKMVALTALMRKIIIMANARLKPIL